MAADRSSQTTPGGSVVLACHQQLLTAGIRHTLTAAHWDVSGVGDTADRTLALVRDRRPDLCMVLVPFPDGAAELVEAVTAVPRRPRVVCLSTEADFDDHDTVRRVFHAGADGWLTLDLPPEVLGRTLDAVRAGEAALSRRHVRLLLSDLRRPEEDQVLLADGRVLRLPPRQLQIVRRIAQGDPTAGIAASLDITPATVRWHVAEVSRKVGVSTRAELLQVLHRSPLAG